jgi:alcohol dehydrogenase class IV
MRFEFATATRILFGSGGLNSIGNLAKDVGEHPMIVSGVPDDLTNRLIDLLKSQELTFTTVKINDEPTIDFIRKLADLAKRSFCDVVISIGGGSAMDAGKSVAAMLTNPGDIYDYLEVIGLGKPISHASAPFIAIPTTAGTGSEVTRNAVLGSTDQRVKVSLRSQFMLPRIALVDPELAIDLPPYITAITGLDALTQLIEPYTCNRPNPLIDAICREGITRVAKSLYRVYENGRDLAAREDMSLASLCGGLALANARLGAVHGLAGPIGGELPAPHAAICARLLPIVMQVNINSVIQRRTENPVLQRYDEVGKILTGKPDANVYDGIQWIQSLCSRFNIQPLASFGLTPANFPSLIEKSLKSSSMKGNPIELTNLDVDTILKLSM